MRPIFSYSLICLFLFTSCGSLSERRSLFGGKEEVKSETVSRHQYEKLLKKYDALMKEKKMAMMKEGESASAGKMSRQSKEQLVDDVVNQLSQVNKKKSLSSSVGSSMEQEKQGPLVIDTGDYDAKVVEEHMAAIQKAFRLEKQNKFDSALSIIKSLEDSPIKQIRVRSKFLLAEILFKQGEFDLAMQIYEEVLTKYAFSGLVIKTLGRLIACSEKLKQVEKQEKYYSFLHDFFEEGA